MSQKSSDKNPKVRATAAIWGCAVGMLGVCIPLVAITNSGIFLPTLVIVGATTATTAVWFAPHRRNPAETRLAQTIKTLEERIITLETIYISLPDGSKPLPLPTPADITEAAKQLQV